MIGLRQILVSSLLLGAEVYAQTDSLCDKYTKALFTNNTAENQYTLLVKVVNTALIGNYTAGAKVKVNGILVPGMFMGQNVSLLHYFNGGLVSTNRGSKASAVNFIDDGGAIPLALDKPANGNTSNQYKLITHLYEFFGALLQCSMYGKTGFPAYSGNANMYDVHKYMNLDPTEMGYFIQEVGLSAASFGVAEADILAVAGALNGTFNQRCAPPVAVIPSAQAGLQAICINTACPLATSAMCSSYSTAVEPATATSTSGPQLTDLAPQLSSIAAGEVTKTEMMSSGATSGTMMMTGSMATTVTDVITSGGSVITMVRTTEVPVTSVPNAGAVQTVAPLMVAVAGAGLVGQMLL
ncbi:hypothetical protein H072_11591 [Dactylellina haptotyla CBS 200.50]|uniref:Uncharacterized protein n=1 Tax=Dactylellina haptotyla (strain CBS 200.50) TaxID=1284197 RepID=S7ZXM3_DACHA|nr:hypothetical protein H072_11591 [Dactylellina haptotyla CBS 200.50]